MEQLLADFASTLVRSVESLYNLAYAVSLTLLLTQLQGGWGRLASVLARRLVFSLAATWLLGTASDLVFPNTITWTLLPAAACVLAFGDWKLPVRLARVALAVTGWMYSIAFAEVINDMAHGGIALASAVSLGYMLILLCVIELLEWRTPLDSRSMTMLVVVPVLVVCASGLAGRSVLILRSDFGLDGFYQVSTLESVLTCLNGQVAELVVYGVILHLVRELSEKQRLMEEGRVNEAQLAGLRAYQESSESFHELRHEVKNQYAYIKMLLEQKDYARAEEFFGEMSMHANPTFAYVATGNGLVDGIVNLGLSRARAADVELSTRIAVPSELPVSETDLCGLLTNLLDNAIEATAGLADAHGAESPDAPTAGERTVRLGMFVDQGALMVTVTNPAAHEPCVTADGRLRTTKTDGRRHGYGTTIVRKIAERYGGIVDFSYAKGVFTARVMLILEE